MTQIYAPGELIFKTKCRSCRKFVPKTSCQRHFCYTCIYSGKAHKFYKGKENKRIKVY